MHELYELKDMLCKELEEYGKKGELTTGSLDVVDKLAHTIKNLNKIIEHYEEDGGYSGRYMYDGGRDRSYARGRKRDSMGRYSRATDGVVDQLHEIMDEVPENMKHEVKRLITKMESM